MLLALYELYYFEILCNFILLLNYEFEKEKNGWLIYCIEGICRTLLRSKHLSNHLDVVSDINLLYVWQLPIIIESSLFHTWNVWYSASLWHLFEFAHAQQQKPEVTTKQALYKTAILSASPFSRNVFIDIDFLIIFSFFPTLLPTISTYPPLSLLA